MARTTLYNLSLISLLIGCLLAGFGIGKLFDKVCEGVSIGLGIGLLLCAFTLFKTYQRLLTFNKDNL